MYSTQNQGYLHHLTPPPEKSIKSQCSMQPHTHACTHTRQALTSSIRMYCWRWTRTQGVFLDMSLLSPLPILNTVRVGAYRVRWWFVHVVISRHPGHWPCRHLQSPVVFCPCGHFWPSWTLAMWAPTVWWWFVSVVTSRHPEHGCRRLQSLVVFCLCGHLSPSWTLAV